MYFFLFYYFPLLIIEYYLDTGLLRGVVIADGARYHDADDSAGADLGAEGDLHSRLVPEGWRSREGSNERGGSLLRAGSEKLRRQNRR